MKTVVFEVPTMYGDHHVLEVRRLLLQMDGVVDVYASSGFQIVEVTFDENQQTPAALEACLSAAGYLGEMQLPVEFGAGVGAVNGKPFFRRPITLETTRELSFTQDVPRSGRALWPCPGMITVRVPDEEVENG